MDEKLNVALKGIWDSLTDEQKAKAKECKSIDELTVLAGKERLELPDEVLDSVAGGWFHFGGGNDPGNPNFTCKLCGKQAKWVGDDYIKGIGQVAKAQCSHCGDIYMANDGCWYEKDGHRLTSLGSSSGGGC